MNQIVPKEILRMGQRGTRNKFNAKRTPYNGRTYDSVFEAEVAQELDLRKRAHDIAEVTPQYQVHINIYDQSGTPVDVVKHRVDFLVEHNDGSFELIEVKGVETADYKWRRRLLEKIWLPEHPQYSYTIRRRATR